MRSIKTNFLWNAVLQVSSLVFPLFIYPYVSRVIGSEGIGKTSFATSVIVYFSIIAQLGVPTYGIRSVAQVANDNDELSKTVQEIFFINIITTIIAYICLGISMKLVPRFQEEPTLLIITSFQMAFNTLGMVWLFSGLERYRYITIRAVFFKFLSLILTFVFVRNRDDYLAYGIILVVAIAGSNVLNFFYSRKFINFKRYKNYNIKRHLKPIMIFFTMSIATNVYTSLDTIMLGFMKNNSEVGFYSSATKVRSVLLGIINALATVMLPRASYYIKVGNKKEFSRISQKAFHFIVITGSAAWVYFSLYAKESILVLSGSEFLPAIYPMLWIMPTVLICGISNLTAIEMLVALGKENSVLISQVAGALIDFVLNSFLIPVHGASSAAAATMIAEFVILNIQIYALHKDGYYLRGDLKIWKIIVGVSVAGGVSCTIKMIGMHPLMMLLVSFSIFTVVYVGVLLLLKEPIAEEIINEVTKKLKTENSKKG